MLNVAIVQRRLAHYRLPLYEKILAGNPDISLALYCGYPENAAGGSGISLAQQDPPYVKRVKTYALKFLRGSVFIHAGVVRALSPKRCAVLVCEGSPQLLSALVLLAWRRLRGAKNVLWLKAWPNAAQEANVKRWLRVAFLRLAQAYIVYGHESKKRLLAYGIAAHRITIAQNTVEVSHLLQREGESEDVKLGKPPHNNSPLEGGVAGDFDGEGKYNLLKSTVWNDNSSNVINTPLKGGIHQHNNSPLEGGRAGVDSDVHKIFEHCRTYIFNIGRHIKEKRISDLLEAFALLQLEKEFIEVALVIAGNGPETHALKQHAQRLRLQHVHFIGAVSDPIADALFLQSTCCVFPGAVGLALNQAMASGKAVICADEPGPDSELLQHERNGMRYSRGNIAELVQCMRTVLRNPKLQNSLGAAARETIQSKATMENMAAQYVAALRSVAEEG